MPYSIIRIYYVKVVILFDVTKHKTINYGSVKLRRSWHIPHSISLSLVTYTKLHVTSPVQVVSLIPARGDCRQIAAEKPPELLIPANQVLELLGSEKKMLELVT